MLSKYSLPHFKSSDYKPKKFWSGFKFLIIALVILIGIYLFVTYIFSQKIADKDLKIAAELQLKDDCKSAISNYKSAAKRSKKDNPTYLTALNGLWACDQLTWAYDYGKKTYDKKPDDNSADLLAQMMISRHLEDTQKRHPEFISGSKIPKPSQSEARQVRDDAKASVLNDAFFQNLLKKSSPLTKITYLTIFENKIDLSSPNLSGIQNSDSKYSDLIKKINSVANIKTKILIIAQYLNENQNAQFGTDLAERVQNSDKNYRDAYITIGYGYLQLSRFENAKITLLQAAKINPVFAPTFELLAEVYKNLGDDKNYQSTLKKAEMLKAY